MLKSHSPSIRRDLVRFGCFILALIGVGVLFLGNPALSMPTMYAIVLATLFSPLVAFLERKGFSRQSAIMVLFAGLAAVGMSFVVLIAKNWNDEWFSIQAKAPEYFSGAVAQINSMEARIKAEYPFMHNLSLAESLSNWGSRTGSWFASRIGGFMSSLLTALFLVPILTFCFLAEGRRIRRGFYQLVPNRFFESVFIVTHGVASALSDYLRAKMIEASLVGLLTTAGLALAHSPYAIVLGLWAGVTNIVPYIGPILGAVPGLAIVALDTHGSAGAIWAIAAVYGAANMIDTVVIFPGIVAKLVKLPALVLIASVILGQYYGGIIGMLVSIPIAAAIKVILSELYVIIYGFVPDP